MQSSAGRHDQSKRTDAVPGAASRCIANVSYTSMKNRAGGRACLVCEKRRGLVSVMLCILYPEYTCGLRNGLAGGRDSLTGYSTRALSTMTT